AENYNTIIAIAPSFLDKDIIWVGTDDGQVQVSDNGGISWNNLTKNIIGLPDGAWIPQIHASKFEKGTAWVVANNYRKGDHASYLFITTDYGRSWKNILNTNQVKGYALSVIQDPIERKLVFLGTENGLWVSINEGKDWAPF
ncbi:MAG: WD40/YVTN/BNR-like repeat-containing protein, partial [Chitinophagaceae bacterium]